MLAMVAHSADCNSSSSSDCTDAAGHWSASVPYSLLPPPPPLKPSPEFCSNFCCTQEPLDYSMKRLRKLEQETRDPDEAADRSSAEQVLHRLRRTVLMKHHQQRAVASAPDAGAQLEAVAKALRMRQMKMEESGRATVVKLDPEANEKLEMKQETGQGHAGDARTADLLLETRAAYAAECIKSRLDGCGKRVHLFLGILLHFGLPPDPSGSPVADPVVAFSDAQKNLTEKPTPYFMVLDSRFLALIWCKFKGNSSSEYSTLTRAIRSTRQKYKGIFESVENPGKKMYKFGPLAVEQFRQLFPQSYS